MRSRRFFLTALPFIIAISSGGVTRSFPKEPVRQFTMDNGLNVILKENKAAPVVALQLWMKIGSADG